MAFDVNTTHDTDSDAGLSSFKRRDCVFPTSDNPHFAGDEIIRTNKRNEEDTKETRPRLSSHTTSTIAEEAVEQLQASEKLIAGKYDILFGRSLSHREDIQRETINNICFRIE